MLDGTYADSISHIGRYWAHLLQQGNIGVHP